MRDLRKGAPTARWLASIRLVAALLIVAGLALSVPPSYGSVQGEHFGMLLHPLFPHVHGDAERAFVPDFAHGAIADAATDDAFAVERTTGIRSHTPEEGFRTTLSGLLLPILLAGIFLQGRQIRFTRTPLADLHWAAPPAPPPRVRTPILVMN